MNRPEPIPFQTEGPQPLLRETPEGAPYPVEALGPLQRAVEAVQGMTLAPVAIPAKSALAVASLVVQCHADVETLGGSSPLSLYAMTIAESGERKSSCDKPLMAALREFERQGAKARRDDVVAWHNRHALWKGKRDRILAEAKTSKDEKRDAAQADLKGLGAEPVAPPVTQRTVTEPTFEGLTRAFVEGLPSLGIFSDEGGQFLGGHGMNSDNRQKTLAALNDLWGGNPIRRTRLGDGSLVLYGRRLAMHLMVQPEIARRFMADPLASGSGFLPRFLICEPTSTIGNRFNAGTRRDDAALADFGARLHEILASSMPMDPETRELEPRLLLLSPEARKLLIGFSDAIEAQQAPGGDLAHVTAYASKAAEQACRIAGVLTLWQNLGAAEVTAEPMGWGIELAQFYLGEAVRLANAATVSAEIERAEALRKWLLEKLARRDTILLREVMRFSPARGALQESPKAKAAIALLESPWMALPVAGRHGRSRRGAEGRLEDREALPCGLTCRRRSLGVNWPPASGEPSAKGPRRYPCRTCRTCRTCPEPGNREFRRQWQESPRAMRRNGPIYFSRAP